MHIPELPRGLAIEARGGARRRPAAAWLLAYPVAWVALATVSTTYWFLPAGLRLALLWVLPRRLWPAMAALDAVAIAVMLLVVRPFDSVFASLLACILPWLVYASVVALVSQRSIQQITPQTVSRLIAVAGIAAVGNALLLSAVNWLNDGTVQRPSTLMVNFAVGDFIGSLVVVPMLALLREQILAPRIEWRRLTGDGLALLPAVVAVVVAIGPLPPDAQYPLIFALLATVWVAFRHGWRAVAVAVAVLSAVVFGLDDTAFERWHETRQQLFIAAIASASLLLGAAIDGLRAQGQALTSTIDMLSVRTRALSDAAQRLTSDQEDQRRRLGAELHDQLGQDMTAIATRLRLLERRSENPALRSELQAITELVAGAHTHLRDVISDLHPLVLNRFGLARALATGPIAEMARSQDVSYACEVEGDLDDLPAPVASALYRICQEAVTNGVRHGCGGRLCVTLERWNAPTGSQLTLRIEDDAGTIAMPADLGERHGLQGIRDRAHAMGASYRFDPTSGNPRHWLHVAMPDAAAEAAGDPAIEPAADA